MEGDDLCLCLSHSLSQTRQSAMATRRTYMGRGRPVLCLFLSSSMPLIRTSISACLRLFTCTVCLCPFTYIQVSFYLPTRVTVHMYVYRCPYVSVLLCVCPSTFELLSVRLCDCLYNPGHLHASVALGESTCMSVYRWPLLHSPSAIYIPCSATTTTSSVNTRTTRKRQTDRHSERERVSLFNLTDRPGIIAWSPTPNHCTPRPAPPHPRFYTEKKRTIGCTPSALWCTDGCRSEGGLRL